MSTLRALSVHGKKDRLLACSDEGELLTQSQIFAQTADGTRLPLLCDEHGRLAVGSGAPPCADDAPAPPQRTKSRRERPSEVMLLHSVDRAADMRCTILSCAQCTVLDGAVVLHSLELRNNTAAEQAVKLYDCRLKELTTSADARKQSLRRGLKVGPQKDDDELDADPADEAFATAAPAAEGESRHGVFSWLLAPHESRSFTFPAGWRFKHGVAARASGDCEAINGNALLACTYSR